MLLILMYHRVYRQGRVADALATHLRYLRDHHPIVLPGDPLPKGELSVCLTFDDATVDFRQVLHPLLERLDARALVAIPTAYIEDSTDQSMDTRLRAQDSAAMSGDYAVNGSPLCTWEELRKLQAGGRVHCASHSHSHANMADPDTDVEAELTRSAVAIQYHLGSPPSTFVYPYGRSSRTVQRRVRRHYRYAMRIGSAINRGWDDNQGLLYRVDAEHFWPDGRTWSFGDSVKYRLKYLGNRLRGR